MALVVGWLLSALPAGAAEPLKILMLGDSLTAGYGLVKGQSVPARLDQALKAGGVDVQIINAGVSGDTSAGGRARLAWALADGPRGLIIELGANDGLRGLDPQQTFANLDAIISQAKAAGLAVLLTGMRAPPNLGPEYGDEFNRIYPDLAARHRVPLYPFFLDGVVADPALNQADGIHPNPDGVAVIVKKLLPLVKAMISAIEK
ncbi:MAG: arylesterase [Rhodospirillales bacterium]|nr:arylesterase [Rhodospirillales bacterium]